MQYGRYQIIVERARCVLGETVVGKRHVECIGLGGYEELRRAAGPEDGKRSEGPCCVEEMAAGPENEQNKQSDEGPEELTVPVDSME